MIMSLHELMAITIITAKLSDHNFSYKVAVGIICAGMAALVLVIIVILCICVSQRRQLIPVGKC